MVCHFCEKSLTDTTDKVRDHDHLNGKYRGAAHSKCNLKARKNNFIPVYFHNGSKYDIHLIFEKLVNGFIERYITHRILSKSEEEYIIIQVGCLKIMDTYRFLSSPLSSLGATLKAEDCHMLQSRGLTVLKGIYPYDYVKTEDGFSEIDRIMSEPSLPPQSAFYSKLQNQTLLYTDYETAQNN